MRIGWGFLKHPTRIQMSFKFNKSQSSESPTLIAHQHIVARFHARRLLRDSCFKSADISIKASVTVAELGLVSVQTSRRSR